jgi:hypothetical protein
LMSSSRNISSYGTPASASSTYICLGILPGHGTDSEFHRNLGIRHELNEVIELLLALSRRQSLAGNDNNAAGEPASMKM